MLNAIYVLRSETSRSRMPASPKLFNQLPHVYTSDIIDNFNHLVERCWINYYAMQSDDKSKIWNVARNTYTYVAHM